MKRKESSTVHGEEYVKCISSAARDLLDLILEQCPPDARQGNSEGFLEWLHSSELISTPFDVNQLKEADKQQCDQMNAMGLSRNDAVYSCAYWLVRYSGMVQPARGDAIA